MAKSGNRPSPASPQRGREAHGPDATDIARAMIELGDKLANQGDLSASRDSYQSALSVAERLAATDPANTQLQRNLSIALEKLGDIAIAQCNRALAGGDLATAAPLAETALVFRRRGTSPQPLIETLQTLGYIATQRHDRRAATDCFTEALDLARREGGVGFEANSLLMLGINARAQDEIAAALAHFEAALAIYRRFGFAYGEAKCLHELGDLAERREDHAAAQVLLEQALALYRDPAAPKPSDEAACLESLGEIAWFRGDRAAAHAHFTAALALYALKPDHVAIGWAHMRLSTVSDGAEYNDHLVAARTAWREAGREDLVERMADTLAKARGTSPT